MKTKTNTTIPTIQPSANRYDGSTYNEIGAVKTDGLYEFTYDALGQPLSKIYNNLSNTEEYYIYTANDERIGVQRGGWWTWSVRDEGGKVLRQYKSSATNTSAPALWLEDFVWRDGLLLGSQRPVEMGGRRHFHLDHLGTPRLITSDSGQMVSYHDYYPFGDEYSPVMQESSSGFGREEPMKFTGHERDYAGGMGAEDGHAVDYMHARYFGPTLGRFLSIDPIEGDAGMPQSWNRYAYVSDNPMNYVDPTGMATTGWVCNDEGCSTTVTPDPPPQLPPGPIVRQSFFWDHPLGALAQMRNPLTGMTVREHAQVTGHGLAAFADGVIPDVPFCDVCDKYTDPFAGAGVYDISEPGMRTNQIIGAATRDIELALLTAGGTMETKAGAEGGNVVTNNVFRWGKGSWKNSGGPQWHVHLGPRRLMIHHLPYQAKAWLYHARGLLR
jgi:RHS repeat-associated protein